MAIFDYVLTSEGDIDLDTICSPTEITGSDALIQISRMHLRKQKGSWFRDTEDGTDWFAVLKKPINRDFIIQVVTASLLQLDFVTSVIDVYTSVDNETRAATLSYVFEANGETFTNTEEL
jgi:hypothetical protein